MRRSGLIVLVGAVLAAFGLGVLVRPLHRADAGPPSVVAQVRLQLETRYYKRVPQRVLRQPTVEAMLDALDDPYTRYLSRAEFRLARRATQEGYCGVGLTVLPGERGLLVTRTNPGPARLAGIRPGDTILAVDGTSVAGLPFEDALGRIIGKEGSRVELHVRRDRHTLTFKLVRERFRRPSVHVRLLAGAVGVVRIDRFALDTAAQAAAAVRALERAQARGIVLDLRGNPGGLLSQAVGVASLFLETGRTVVSLSGAHRRDRIVFARGGTKTRLPVVVAVDGASASAAEVVAAALRDHGRARVVGSRTFGKSLVQEVGALASGGALKLTVATYRTPTGRDLSAGGVRPDVPSANPLAAARRLLVART